MYLYFTGILLHVQYVKHVCNKIVLYELLPIYIYLSTYDGVQTCEKSIFLLLYYYRKQSEYYIVNWLFVKPSELLHIVLLTCSLNFFYQSKTKLGNMYYVYGVNYEIELIFIDLRNGWQREKYSSLSLSLSLVL